VILSGLAGGMIATFILIPLVKIERVNAKVVFAERMVVRGPGEKNRIVIGSYRDAQGKKVDTGIRMFDVNNAARSEFALTGGGAPRIVLRGDNSRIGLAESFATNPIKTNYVMMSLENSIPSLSLGKGSAAARLRLDAPMAEFFMETPSKNSLHLDVPNSRNWPSIWIGSPEWGNRRSPILLENR
jgi:hypothetical protein